MARKDDISSTEKLLSLIRDEGSDRSGSIDLPSSGKTRTRKKGKAGTPIKFLKGKTVTLGVDLGRTQLKMVAIGQATNDKPALDHYSTIPYTKGLSTDHSGFPLFLKSVLDSFCGSAKKKIQIWTAIPSTAVETQYLRTPKVPKNQIINTVLWSYKKERQFNESDHLFDFEIIGDTIEKGIQKTEVIAYTAPKDDVTRIRDIFSKAGYPVTGVSIVPFALQNLFRTGWKETGGGSVCTLFIGTDWSRIAIFTNKNMVLSREIKAGMQGMAEAVAEGLEKMRSNAASVAEDKTVLELETRESWENQRFLDLAQRTLSGFIAGDLSESKEAMGGDVDPEDVFRWITPALDRVIRQVERTLEHYSLNYENERIQKIYLSGSICSHADLVKYIADQTGLSVDYIDPFESELPGAVNVRWPESIQDRGDFVPVVGLGLSDNSRTPNFLYTYKDKQSAEKIDRLNRSIFGVAIVLMLVCIGYFSWQSRILNQRKTTFNKLQREMTGFIPHVDQNMILQLVTNSFSGERNMDAYADKYKGMAVISEIVKITPPNVRLSEMTIQLGGVKIDSGPVKAKEKERSRGKAKAKEETKPVKMLMVAGVISGDRVAFESTLAGYLVKIKNSPLFGRPEIVSQTPEVLADKEVLRFTAQITII